MVLLVLRYMIRISVSQKSMVDTDSCCICTWQGKPDIFEDKVMPLYARREGKVEL
jgi:hypothetical protein